jgi:hypothetical protein
VTVHKVALKQSTDQDKRHYVTEDNPRCCHTVNIIFDDYLYHQCVWIKHEQDFMIIINCTATVSLNLLQQNKDYNEALKHITVIVELIKIRLFICCVD